MKLNSYEDDREQQKGWKKKSDSGSHEHRTEEDDPETGDGPMLP
jgi:hypothetical protein